jgi:hypothetical protein
MIGGEGWKTGKKRAGTGEEEASDAATTLTSARSLFPGSAQERKKTGLDFILP